MLYTFLSAAALIRIYTCKSELSIYNLYRFLNRPFRTNLDDEKCVRQYLLSCRAFAYYIRMISGRCVGEGHVGNLRFSHSAHPTLPSSDDDYPSPLVSLISLSFQYVHTNITLSPPHSGFSQVGVDYTDLGEKKGRIECCDQQY